MTTKGLAAPEVEQAYTRARELCQQVGETPQLFPVLLGLWFFIMCAGSYQTARDWGSSSSAWPSTSKTRLLVEAHRALGQYLVLSREIAAARAHLEQGWPSTIPSSIAPWPSYGQDPG